MKKVLTAPIKDEDLTDLRIGDYIYYSGILATGRDDVHHKVVQLNIPCPVDLSGLALFHAGPIVKETPKGNTIVAVGPTSSVRMEQEEAEFLRKTGVKLLIGKGAMGAKTAAACKELKAIHCNFPGGCAVRAANSVRRIIDVKWRELGMPECMWVMEVQEFGPLIVTIDTEGNNLFLQNQAYYEQQKQRLLPEMTEILKGYME